MNSPLDARLAIWLIRPLAGLPISPNAITAAGLAFGLTAAWCFAQGNPNWGGGLFALAALMDHADGELARMTGKTSRFGHVFDRVSSATNYTAVFLGMGIGLDASVGQALNLGIDGGTMGLIAGGAVAAIFGLRNMDKNFIDQAKTGNFEHEDIMYLIAPLAWLGWQGWFVILACIGAPLYLIGVSLKFWWRRLSKDA